MGFYPFFQSLKLPNIYIRENVKTAPTKFLSHVQKISD